MMGTPSGAKPASGRERRRHPSTRSGDETIYVYCVVDRDRPVSLRGVSGGVPGGSRPWLLPITQRLSVVASRVPRERYAPAAIDSRLRDLDWVAAIALAHEAVVERMVRAPGATVIPMKLFSMFSEPDRAIAELRRNRRQLERIVRRIHGADEWGVRVTRGQADPAPRRIPPPASGTAFLAARQQARDALQQQAMQMREAAETTLRLLAPLAKDSATRPAPEGAAAPPLLDAVFLVPRVKKARFRSAVRQAARHCRAAGADLTLTGPWPAYHFVNGGGST